VLEQRPLGDDPAIVGGEAVANGRRRHDRGEKARHEGGLPRRYSHSIVAGGLELTS